MVNIEYNGVSYRLPENLMEITLGERIEFWEKHDRDIEEKIRAIRSKYEVGINMSEDDVSELTAIDIERSISAYSFFGKIPKEVVENELPYSEVYSFYCDVLNYLVSDEIRPVMINTYEWDGETWEIPMATLTNGDGKSSREVLYSFNILKETDKLLKEYAIGKVHVLLPLCCIWLKKKGEVFTTKIAEIGSDRQELFKKLPMEIALNVGFFFRNSWSMYMPILTSSHLEAEVEVE